MQEKADEVTQDKPNLKSLLQTRLSRLEIMPAQQLEQHAPPLHEPHSFLANEETVFFNTNIGTEEFNASVASYVPHATVALNWSALVRKDDVQRVASGLQVQSCLQADATCVVSNAVSRELGLDVSLRNVHAAQSTEMYINSLSLYSKEYSLKPNNLYSKCS